MKKVQFDKLVSLTVDGKNVVVNGAKFEIREDNLVEVIKKEMPYTEVRELTDKYDLVNGQIQPEDAEEYMKEIDTLQEKYMEYNEVVLYIGNKNVLENIKELESL